MIAFLTGEIIGPMLGGGLEKLEGFNFTSLSMVYLCIMIFGASLPHPAAARSAAMLRFTSG